jgi:hypothetical protein
MFKLKHNDGGASASWDGKQFVADAEGFISVPAQAVGDLAAHGWEAVTAAVEQAVIAVEHAVIGDPVEHLLANLDQVSEQGVAQIRGAFNIEPPTLADMAEQVIAQAASLPVDVAGRLEKAFAPPKSADPVQDFLDHLASLDASAIESALAIVVPKVKDLLASKTPPQQPQAPKSDDAPPQADAASTGGAA